MQVECGRRLRIAKGAGGRLAHGPTVDSSASGPGLKSASWEAFKGARWVHSRGGAG